MENDCIKGYDYKGIDSNKLELASCQLSLNGIVSVRRVLAYVLQGLLFLDTSFYLHPTSIAGSCTRE